MNAYKQTYIRLDKKYEALREQSETPKSVESLKLILDQMQVINEIMDILIKK